MAPFDSNGKFIIPTNIDLGEVTMPVIDGNPRSTYRLAKDDERRIAKLNSCMCLWTVYSANDGLAREIHRMCGYHDCKTCGKFYANGYRKRIAESGAVYMMVTDRETATNICRITKNKYDFLRMPSTDADYLFFRLDSAYSDNTEFISLTESKTLVDKTLLEFLPFEELQAVPDNRRISGKLGITPTLEDDAVTVVVNQPMVRIIDTAAPNLVNRKFRATMTAMVYTVAEAPKTVDELQGSLYRRVNCYTDALDADGLKYEIIYAKVKVDLKKICWWQSLLYVVEMTFRQGVKSGSNFIKRAKDIVTGWGADAKRRIDIYISSLNLSHDDDLVVGLRSLLVT